MKNKKVCLIAIFVILILFCLGAKADAVTLFNSVNEVKSTIIAEKIKSIILPILIFSVVGVSLFEGIKSKKFRKVFILIPFVAALSFFGNGTYAATTLVNDVSTEKAEIGLFDNFEVDKNGNKENFLFISPNVGLNSKDGNFYIKDLKEFLDKNSLCILNFNESAALESTVIKTGDKIKLSNDGEYVVVLFGDIDGDGAVCTSNDLAKIKEVVLNSDISKSLSVANRLAANVKFQLDENNISIFDENGLIVINSFDMCRIRAKILGYDGQFAEIENKIGSTLVESQLFKKDESKNSFSVSNDGINWNEKNTLKEAVDSIGEVGTIKVLKSSFDENELVTISENQNITLDLNNKKIVLKNSLVVNGIFSIKDDSENKNGYLKANDCIENCFIKGNEGSTIKVISGCVISKINTIEGFNVIIEGGKIQSGYADGVAGKNAVVINNGNVDVISGEIKVTNESESCIYQKNNGNITILGGTISQEKEANCAAIMQDVEQGNIVIKNSIITGAKVAVCQKSGNDLFIDYEDVLEKNYTDISQMNVDTNDEKNAVIVKLSEGLIKIGCEENQRVYSNELCIKYKSTGIYAPNAEVQFLNGKITTNSESIGHVINEVNNFITSSKFELDSKIEVVDRDNKKIIKNSMLKYKV